MPVAMRDRERHADVHQRVRDLAIQRSVIDVDRVALRTMRLLVRLSDLFRREVRWRLREQLPGRFLILAAHQQTHAADHVRVEPIEPDHVLVGQETLDPRRLQLALGEQRFRQIAEARHHHQLLVHLLPLCLRDHASICFFSLAGTAMLYIYDQRQAFCRTLQNNIHRKKVAHRTAEHSVSERFPYRRSNINAPVSRGRRQEKIHLFARVIATVPRVIRDPVPVEVGFVRDAEIPSPQERIRSIGYLDTEEFLRRSCPRPEDLVQRLSNSGIYTLRRGRFTFGFDTRAGLVELKERCSDHLRRVLAKRATSHQQQGRHS